jgi:hypothetical protein
VHELEKYARTKVSREAELRIDSEVQDCEAFVRGSHEDRHPHGPSAIGHCKQRLHAGYVADAHPQTAILLINLGDAVDIYGLLDSDPHAVLVYIEKEELFQGWTLLCS